jgi:hypothetical protein
MFEIESFKKISIPYFVVLKDTNKFNHFFLTLVIMLNKLLLSTLIAAIRIK